MQSSSQARHHPRTPRAAPGRWGLCLLSGLLAVGAGQAQALTPDRALTQYTRASWIAKDGAPAGTITGITQTPDGYLWLGTEGEGLVRFDGVAFVRANALDELFGKRITRVTSLTTGRDGALWVGTNYGLARLSAGRWSVFDRGESKPVFGLHEASDGTVWYGRHWEGLYRLVGETPTLLPLEGKPRFVTSDARGDLWVGGYEGLWHLAGERRRLYSTREGLPDPDVTHVFGDRAGNVWVGLRVGLTLWRDGRLVRHFTARDGLSSEEVSVLYVDRAGDLWVGTTDGGLNRRRGERFESMTKALGLTNDRVTALYEDREGSLWIGTGDGLNQLRDASFLPIGASEGLSPRQPHAIVEGADGTVFVSSGFGGISSIKNGRVSAVRPDSAPGAGFDGPLFADRDGALWSGRRNGLSCHRGAQARGYRVDGLVTCVGRDARSIVFGTDTGRLFRLLDGRPQRYRLADGRLLGPETFGFDYVWMIHLARDGTLWLATSRGALAVREGRARVAWREGTLSARALCEDENGTIWLGTLAGAVRIAGESVTTFTTKNGLPYDDVYHILDDRQGALWMSGVRGVFRVQRRDLERVASGQATAVTVEMFGVADGMRTAEATDIHQPAGCATRDGRLWFPTTAGVVVVDPTRILRNTLAPPVVVESLVMDGQPLDVAAQGRLPAGTQRIAIHYAGLSLLVPQRVRFKYRLDGYDRDWVDAGNRRVADYTKLPPGSYTFRVTAANNDGVWNATGASLRIVQLPRFYQTAPFAAAVVLAVGGAAFGLHRLRVRKHVQAARALEVRVAAALAQIKTLRGLLPICAWCRKVRDDSGYWSELEKYVLDHTETEFSHGICPECRDRSFKPDEDVAPGS